MSPEFPEDVRPQWPSMQNQPPQNEGGPNAGQQHHRPPQPRNIVGPPQGLGRPVNPSTPRIAIGQTPQWVIDKQNQSAAPQAEEAGLLGFAEQTDEGKKHPVLKAIGWTVVAAAVLGVGGAFADEFVTGGKNLEKIGFGTAPRKHDPVIATPQETLPTEEESTAPTPSPTTTTKPSPTTTPKPTPTQTKLALPTTVEACAAALPADLKVGQLIETTIDANSDMGEIQRIVASGYAGSGLILHYPLEKDGKTPDVAAVKALKTANKDIPFLETIDDEGGQINRSPGAKVPPGPDMLSATKPAAGAFEEQIKNYYEHAADDGVDVILAPVQDIQGASKEKTYGRLFRTSADAAKYTPSYVAAAKDSEVILTFKHFPQVLEYGNTDTLAKVTTPSYADLEKAGYLNGYKLVKGTNNWIMMGSAYTKFANTTLDNGQLAAFNPAAYDAARKLAGDPLFITDALNAKSVNAVTTQAEAAARAIKAGADIAMVVPREGFSTTDTRAAFAEVKKLPIGIIDDRFLKVLGAKGVNACTVLSKDPRYAAPAAKPTVTSPSKTTQPTITSRNAVPGDRGKVVHPTLAPTSTYTAKPM
jgi:beta-glucosidase-like glycosyl hydrolase